MFIGWDGSGGQCVLFNHNLMNLIKGFLEDCDCNYDCSISVSITTREGKYFATLGTPYFKNG